MISGVYKIINKINGNYYVGGTIDLHGKDGRLLRHKKHLIRNVHHNKHLQHAWNKYGESSFEFVIMETVDIKNVLVAEQKYLDIAATEKGKVYNVVFTASNCHFSDNPGWRKKLSKSGKLKIFTDIHKKHISEAKTGHGINPMKYNWSNKKTGEQFSGSMFDFYTKYGIRRKYVIDLKSGCRKSYLGWTVTPLPEQ